MIYRPIRVTVPDRDPGPLASMGRGTLNGLGSDLRARIATAECLFQGLIDRLVASYGMLA